jgi:hypothetical protein
MMKPTTAKLTLTLHPTTLDKPCQQLQALNPNHGSSPNSKLGITLKTLKDMVDVPALNAALVFTVNKSELFGGTLCKDTSCYVSVVAVAEPPAGLRPGQAGYGGGGGDEKGQQLVSDVQLFFSDFKNLKLDKPEIKLGGFQQVRKHKGEVGEVK